MSHKFLILSIVASLLISMTACQKTETTPKVSGISQEDLALAKRIESFIEKMNNPTTLKSGGLFDVNEALWDLGAAMNYTYANVPEEYEDVRKDSLAFQLKTTSIFCTASDFFALYQEMDSAVYAYCLSLEEGYQLLGVKIAIDQPIIGGISLKAYLISVENMQNPIFTFGPTDYWYAGMLRGKCGDYEGQFFKKRDATTEIQKRANLSLPKIAIPMGGSVYYTDLSDVHYSGWTGNIPNPNYIPGVDDPLKEYLFYYECPAVYNHCLPPDLMNFFLTNIKNFANDNCPAGKVIISYTCEYGFTIPQEWPKEFHEGKVTYAIRHIKPGGPIQQ